MRDNEDDLLIKYYASHRASAIINYNEVSKNIIDSKEIGRVFAEYRDKLVIIDGENKKEHVYLIPKTKIDRYGDNQVYFNISENSLKEFEI
jgi:hypothetical protein